ncbi:MAG: Major facilitator superfamily 1 [Pedosphaera sp.]|nr:Major facilitator superfamily 1 [Pedosphaera sp.]
MALVPLYLLIQKDFQLASEGEATLLVTVMGIAYFLPSYPMGMLADRVSRKKLLAIGLAINGLGFVGLALAPNYACALACVTLAGFGGSFYHPAATALVARLYPVGTGKALGLVAIGASIGFFVSPIYTGWRAEMAHSWRPPILELGVLGIVCAGLFYWLADEERAPAPHARHNAPAQKMFPTSALWLFFLSASFFFSLRDFGGTGMASLCSLFLQQAHGLDPQKTGLILSGIFLASAISNPLFGRLSDRGRVRWAAFLITLAFAVIVVFPHLSKAWLFTALMAYGFFFLASYPVVEAALMESVPDAVRGRVFGLFITTGGLIGNLSHWAMGAAVQKLGINAASPAAYFPIFGFLALMVLLSLLGLPCLHAIRKRESLDAHAGVRPPDSPIITPQSAIGK